VIRSAWIVGSGLAGASVNFELLRNGCTDITVFEATERWGGISRSAVSDEGVIYEPHGTHVLHTEDKEVWDILTGLTPFWRYEHSVVTMVRGRKMTWPIQAQEVAAVYGEKVLDDLTETQMNPAGVDFETWCLAIMPEEIYRDFVANYTEKQWGIAPRELSADFAPKRVQVRVNGDKRLFQDTYQGFPDAREGGSYDQMHRGLWGSTLDTGLRLGTHQTLRSLEAELQREGAPDIVVVTAPLDEFCEYELGTLEWRGLTFKYQHCTVGDGGFEGGFKTDGMQVNWPGKEWPFIRTHETKHASRQEIDATVVAVEFPGGPGKYYPVPKRGGTELNAKYMDYVRSRLERYAPLLITGRLATYRYLDQDDVVRESLDAVRSVV
jgi:UDP-galactopyranose mutase